MKKRKPPKNSIEYIRDSVTSAVRSNKPISSEWFGSCVFLLRKLGSCEEMQLSIGRTLLSTRDECAEIEERYNILKTYMEESCYIDVDRLVDELKCLTPD